MQVEKFRKDRQVLNITKAVKAEQVLQDVPPLSHHLKPSSKQYFSSRTQLCSRYIRHNSSQLGNDAQYRFCLLKTSGLVQAGPYPSQVSTKEKKDLQLHSKKNAVYFREGQNMGPNVVLDSLQEYC